MSDVQVTINGTTGISAVAGVGDTVNVSAGAVVGPLPQLQVAAGNGITINTSGGVSTISANIAELSIPASLTDLTDVLATSPSSGQALTWNGTQWDAANVPVGTTLNGLSGAVTLVAGDGVNLAQNGQNITVSSDINISNYATTAYVDEQLEGVVASEPFVRDLTLVQTLDGKQHYSWMANDEYSQGYFVEIQQVNVTQNLDTALTIETLSDGSLNLSVAMDTSGVAFALPFSIQNATVGYSTELPFDNFATNGTNLLIYGVYLSQEFDSPGNYPFFARVADAAELTIGFTNALEIPITSHGSPVPPEIVSKGADGMNVTAVVESTQTPHQRGFYDLGNLTYYLEINQNASATTGWVRGPGVAGPGVVETLTATAPTTGNWFARVVASNPLGFGSPGEAI